jgi:hypothetical protein
VRGLGTVVGHLRAIFARRCVRSWLANRSALTCHVTRLHNRPTSRHDSSRLGYRRARRAGGGLTRKGRAQYFVSDQPARG